MSRAVSYAVGLADKGVGIVKDGVELVEDSVIGKRANRDQYIAKRYVII